MKIGIYGGSFNPIHKGHTKIAKIIIDEFNLDKLFFVPAFKSPFKTKIKYAPAKDRVNMINLVKPDKSEVSLFEINRKGVSYTIDTVKYFKNKFPDDELFLIIGSDNLYKLNKWKEIDTISQLSKIIVYQREGKFSRENIKKYNCNLLKKELIDFASSNFRKGILSNSDDVVIEYISSRYLYALDILANMVDAKRHKHSIATGNLAAKYAKHLKLDPKKAWFAGIFHDITKGQSKKWHREFLESKGIDQSKLDDHQLHSLSAYYWIKDEYKMDDKVILNAIKVHTSLEKNISLFDKIIYAADKLAEGRKFEGIQNARKLMFSDFDKGFKNIVSITYQHLLKTRGKIAENQKEIYEYLINN
ncbi:MAG: nicotinate-nucleotide adenylyltransferase [Mycoplasmatales bacterium]|nr:nicotinate-nucleotide adenylyltransferase [Mycoplasmatales bacterium]